jgi:hypothetical protein
MLTCGTCFKDYITHCETGILVHTFLAPNTDYTWKIQDKFGNEYEGSVTTNANGEFTIPVEDLPAGLLTEFSGKFKLQVYNAGCRPVNLLMAQEYDCIEFEVRGGTSIKDEIGCEVQCASSEGALSELIPFINATEVVILWTPERLANFGNNPHIEVNHLVSGTTYVLTSVPVERVTVDGVLTQLVIQNGVSISGYVLIS